MKEHQSLEQFKLKLKNRNLKATSQRIAVHEAMLFLGHASADMVVGRIREQNTAKVTLASVYNILNQLADINIYKRRLSMNSKMFFDVNTGKHVHLYDTVSGEFKDVLDDEIIDIIESHFRKKRFRGYKLDDIDIQLICHPNAKRTNSQQ